MEYVWAMQHHPPKEVRKAQRIIFSVVYNADEKSSLIPVLISRLEYRRSEKVVFGRTGCYLWKGTRGFWQAVEEAEDKTQHKRCKCKNQEKRNAKITFLHILGHYIA